MKHEIKALRDVFFSPDSVSLLKEYAEVVADALITDDTLKAIPAVNTVIGIFRFQSVLSQKFNLRKIAAFIDCLHDVSETDKLRFLDKLNDQDQQEKLFEQIVLHLEKLDELIKAEMTGNLFRMFIAGEVSKHIFLRCCRVIDSAYVSDLIDFFKCFAHIIGDQNLDYSRFAEYNDTGMALKDLNSNLRNLDILERDLVMLKRDQRIINGGLQPVTCAESSLNPVGRALAMFMFYDYHHPAFITFLEARNTGHLTM